MYRSGATAKSAALWQFQKMASKPSKASLVEPATLDDLKQISDELRFEISEGEMSEYLEWVNKTLKSYERMENIDEQTIPVLYQRSPGVKPESKDNPYNAWATRMVIKGEHKGLLAGKKLVIKDNIFVAGTPIENGSKVWEGYTPEFDATVVTRILQAGGTIVGKSTCENQCYSGNSFTSASGPVLNPHDTTRSAGGSSSGSAVLLVTGEVDMAMGGDQGGSIRGPASWSGCVGLKPTFGLVPVTGAIGLEPTLDHVGPMAANVTDVATLLEAIAGYDEGRDHRQRPDLPVPKYSQMLKGDLTGVKFAYVTEWVNNADLGVKSVIDATVVKMKSAGATVEKVSIPIQGGILWSVLHMAISQSMVLDCGQSPGYNEFYSISAAEHLHQALQTKAHTLQPVTKATSLLRKYVNKKHGNKLIASAMNRIPTLRKAYDEVLDVYDALIMPTMLKVAPQLPDPDCTITDYIREAQNMGHNTAKFNLTGHPALSINAGTAHPENGGKVSLPVGLQIVCKHHEDAKLLDIAFGVEKLLSN